MHFDVVIVGGGLAGLSLAAALSDTPLKLALIERQAPRRPAGWDARIYAISPANIDFLEEIGLWKHLDDSRIAPIRAMEIRGDDADNARLEFSAYETGLDRLGVIAESSLVACELWESAKRQRNLSLFCPGTPQGIELGIKNTTLRLADGNALTARLIVAADGRDSWVRRTYGLAAQETPYHEKGVVANFECDLPHHDTAYQWFINDGTENGSGNNSVLAYLPLPGNRISIVWSVPERQAGELLALTEEEFCARVAAAGAHKLGALKLITPPAAFALRLIRVPRIVAPGLALIGDAAHGIHPLSGHGINLGFQDARALAAVLKDCPPWQDIGSERVLERYQRMRREEILLLQSVTHGLRRLYQSTLPGSRLLRSLGLNFTDALPFLKNALTRYATGTF